MYLYIKCVCACIVCMYVSLSLSLCVLYEFSYYTICVLKLYMCPHTLACKKEGRGCVWMSGLTTICPQTMYICPREKGKKKEGRECEGMSCVIYGELGYQKKIKQKKWILGPRCAQRRLTSKRTRSSFLRSNWLLCAGAKMTMRGRFATQACAPLNQSWCIGLMDVYSKTASS